jgi:hypothetical protein
VSKYLIYEHAICANCLTAEWDLRVGSNTEGS